MFSKVGEARMRRIRGALALGWLVLIASLFQDPCTSWLTRPDHPWSPFRLSDHQVMVQGVALEQAPYPMGTRFFWTMVLPCVPLFLMVFGHEAWRRICPLSFFSQIPRTLGRHRWLRSFDRTSGQVAKKLRLVPPESWLKRNFWYVQFGLLWLGVSARIVAINASGPALGTFFLMVIAVAMTVGYLYGGKTWCNYICPVSVVQRIYTEPHGLFESQAHLQKQPITQSMCRVSTAQGEQSACVGCLSPCPDIDLERAYWQTLEHPGRRFAYYGYFGLVLGFYGYYYLYAGNWDYYYSGIWTHEIGTLSAAKLLGPGLYLGGVPVAVPKFVAAPLTIAAFIFAAYGLGCAAERLYGWALARLQRPLERRVLLHRSFSVTTYLSINAFYLFGGRPNIHLLPPFLQSAVTAAIVTLSTLWLVRSLARSPTRYQRESVVNTLLKQLKKFKADFTRFLEGRSLDDLTPDEVYLLAKTLPGFSQEQKQGVYKDVLRESIATGRTNSSHSLTMLAELRLQVGVSEDQHHAILKELGIEDPVLLNPQARKAQEDQLRLDSYRTAMQGVMARAAEQGLAPDRVGESAGLAAELRALHSVYQISREEQTRMQEELEQSRAGPLDHAASMLREVGRLTSTLYSLRHLTPDPANPLCRLLHRGVAEIRHRHAATLLRIAASARDDAMLMHFAGQLYGLLGQEADNLIRTRQWDATVKAHPGAAKPLLLALAGKPTQRSHPPAEALPKFNLRDAIRPAAEPAAVYATLARDVDPIISGIALLALAQSEPAQASEMLRGILEEFDEVPWFLLEVSTSLLRTEPTTPEQPPAATDGGYVLQFATTVAKLGWLMKVDLFERMPLGALAELARHGELRRYGQGARVCQEGERSDAMFLVLDGVADVSHRIHAIPQRVGRVTAGQAVGEMGVFTKKPRSATVVIASDTADLLAFGEEHLDQVWENPHASRGILLRVSDYYQMERGRDGRGESPVRAPEVADQRPRLAAR